MIGSFRENDAVELGLGGRTVLVTGGSKGIGLACARAFQAEGARVAIVSRSQPNLEAAARPLPGVVCSAADLTRAEAAGEAIARAQATLRRYAAPEDIAGLTLFLASDRAGYITGAIVPMDGGSNPVL